MQNKRLNNVKALAKTVLRDIVRVRPDMLYWCIESELDLEYLHTMSKRDQKQFLKDITETAKATYTLPPRQQRPNHL